MTASDRTLIARPTFGLARIVSTVVGGGLILYGIKRRSWIGRLLLSAGIGLVSKSIGTEGTLAAAFATLRSRLGTVDQRRLQAPR